MSYIFRGTLCGYICPDCPENLSHVTVRLYRLRDDRQATALVAARAKETFGILSEKEGAAKQSALLAETETDENGRFEVSLGEDQEYDGEAFQIDVQLTGVPGREEASQEALQFTITTLQPRHPARGLWPWRSGFWVYGGSQTEGILPAARAWRSVQASAVPVFICSSG